MTALAYDSATPWDRDRLAQVKANGGIAVTVYIVGTPGGMRCANRDDVDLARSMGLGVVPNWERAADFFRTASLDDCRAAGREALAACRELGLPDDGTIGVPFSFDYQVPASEYGRARRQLAAIGQGLDGHYVPLIYGQSGLIRYLALRGNKNVHWLMASTWGLRFNPKSEHVAMVQSHDADGNWLNTHVAGTDVNTVTQPAKLLAWWPDNSEHTTQQEDTMAVTPAYIAKFFRGADKKPHQVRTLIAEQVAPVLKIAADIDKRVAAIQAELAAQKSNGQVHVTPTDVPATLHIGGNQ